MKSKEERDRFIRQLAEFLAENQASKSIALEVETFGSNCCCARFATEWARLRETGNIKGWATVEETEARLQELL